MKTFFNILQTIIKKKQKTYPDEPFKPYNLGDLDIYNEESYHIDFLISKVFHEEKKSKYVDPIMRNAQAKFMALNSILENSFYKNELKERLINIFSKAQKCYYAFSRLSRIYKNKKYPTVVSDDLMLNPLDINHKNTFILIEKKSKYLFSLNDLVSIIENAISNSPNFFSHPLSPLNPYNKEKFTDSTLYNIYFKLKESGRLMSILFHLFFLESFHKENFSDKNEPNIRAHSIESYVRNSHYTTLHPSVLTMLRSNPYTKKYKIHEDFPKDILVEIFRPFLFYFYIINYDLKNTSKFYNYKQILYIKLKKFYEHNKAFGRQYIKLTKHFGRIIKKEKKFNTEYISFCKIPITNETSHNEVIIFRNSSTINILINNSIFNANDDSYPSDEEDTEEDTDEQQTNTEQQANADEDWNNVIDEINDQIQSAIATIENENENENEDEHEETDSIS
jgi:hypothetical protein